MAEPVILHGELESATPEPENILSEQELSRALRFARTLKAPDAEDILQNAALRALQTPPLAGRLERFWQYLERARPPRPQAPLSRELESPGPSPEDLILAAEVELDLAAAKARLRHYLDRFCHNHLKYSWFRILEELLGVAEDPVEALLAVHGFLFPRECPHRPGERKLVSALLRRQLGLQRALFDVHVFRARRAWKALLTELRSDPDLSRALRSSTACPRPSVLAALRARRRPAPRH